MKTAPLIALGAIAIASHAGATTTIYNDAATFGAAAGGLVLETFDAATPVVLNGHTPPTAGTVTVEHVGSDGNSFIDDGTGANNIDGTQFLDIFVGPEFVPIFPRESFDITLPYAVTAVGFDLADFFSTGTSFGSDISLDGVVITDAQLAPPGPRIVYINPAFTRITGWEARDIIGKTPRILQGPKTDRRVIEIGRAHV